MNGRVNALVGFTAAAFLSVGASSFAQDKPEPPMHMHKSEMNHAKSDPEVAVEYKSEAAQLREKAASHRKLAQFYRTPSGPKNTDRSSVAKHCDNLAKLLEDAAKEADAISTALGAK